MVCAEVRRVAFGRLPPENAAAMIRKLFIASLFLTAPACGSDSNSQVETILALTGNSAAGAPFYTSAGCADQECHAANGATGDAPNLHTKISSDDSAVLRVIIEGEGDMPAAEGLTDQNLRDLLAYLRSAEFAALAPQ